MQRTATLIAIVALALGGCSSSDPAQRDAAAADAAQDAPAPEPDAAPEPDLGADAVAADLPAAPSPIGRACQGDGDCDPGDLCLDDSKQLSLPGGYCTRPCAAAPESACGAGALCANLLGMDLCALTCDGDEGCRAGYACEPSLLDFAAPAGQKICVPGRRDATVGDPCTALFDCAPGVGLCLTDQQDGYCTAACDPAQADACGSEAECLAQQGFPLGGMCAKRCADDNECRGGVGQACATTFGGRPAQGKVCAPGDRSAAVGDPCAWPNDCPVGDGYCFDAANSGLRDGYCVALCDPGAADPCGPDAVCTSFPFGASLCLARCAGETCRAGYACVDGFTGVSTGTPVCAPGQAATVPIGHECADGGDCTAGTQGCLPATAGRWLPGGYCSADCSTAVSGPSCPPDSACVPLGHPAAGQCWATCTTDGDCAALRSPGSAGTYGCAIRLSTGARVPGGARVCVAVNPTAQIGDPCVDGSDCGSGLGRCIFDENPVAVPRFAGGYCTLDCDPAAAENSCGDGAVCHAVSKGSTLGGSCVKTCAGDGDCRQAEGYSCKPASSGPQACLP